MKKQAHVYYSGHVQGIGFRYTLADIAKQHNVAGWVKNLEDSRVEVVAEADEEALKSFLQEASQYFFREIKEASVEWLPASGEFREFSIKF